MDLRVGLLIHFGAPTLKEGLNRIVNNLPTSAPPREPMSLNESDLEDTALEWFESIGYAIAHGPELAPQQKQPFFSGGHGTWETEV